MKQWNVGEKHKTGSKTFESLSWKSGLLLSIACCIALIHVELRIQEHHRLISHSVALCGQMETQILRVQQKNGRWKITKSSPSDLRARNRGWVLGILKAEIAKLFATTKASYLSLCKYHYNVARIFAYSNSIARVSFIFPLSTLMMLIN